jgi:hypothetical protein
MANSDDGLEPQQRALLEDVADRLARLFALPLNSSLGGANKAAEVIGDLRTRDVPRLGEICLRRADLYPDRAKHLRLAARFVFAVLGEVIDVRDAKDKAKDN